MWMEREDLPAPPAVSATPPTALPAVLVTPPAASGRES